MTGENTTEELQPPSETSVRMRNGLRRAAIWAAVAAAVVLGLGLIGGVMAGSALLGSGIFGWLAAGTAVGTGAAGSVAATALGAALPYVLGVIGAAGLVGGVLGYSDDRAVQTANDEFERNQHQAQLGQLERQRMGLALQRQTAENARHMAARGTAPGEIGTFMPPNVPFGNNGGGGGGPGRLV